MNSSNRSATFYESNAWRPAVYKKILCLFNQIERSTKKLPIDIKKNIISNIETQLIDTLIWIVFIDEEYNDIKKRLSYIDEALEILHKVVITVRILYDLNYIHPKGFSAITLLEDNAEKQLIGWRTATALALGESGSEEEK